MSRPRRGPRRLRAAPTLAQVLNPNVGTVSNTPPKISRRPQAKARHIVAAGDLVQFHTANDHVSGTTGRVIGYLSKNEVLIETLGGRDRDYPPMKMVVDPREYDVDNWNGNSKVNPYYIPHIQRVLHRATPLPAKKDEKALPKVKVVKTHEELAALLSGEVEVDASRVAVALEEAQLIVDQAKENKA